MGEDRKTSFRLPFLFIISGIILFAAFHLLSIGTWFDWANAHPRTSSVLSNVHLLFLGWATMIATGAVYQLIQVVLQSNIFSTTLGYMNYLFFMVGVIGLILGFRYSTYWLAISASFAFIGLMLFILNVSITLVKAKKWNEISISIGLAVLYLFLAGLMGLLMGIDFYKGGLGDWHQRLFGAHLWFGAIGWFGLLITGFSYKLYPMFYLAHDFPVKLQRYVILCWGAGVAIGAIGSLVNGPKWLQWFSVLLVVASTIIYSIHLAEIKKHKFKNQPGYGVVFARYMVYGLMVVGIFILIGYPFIMDEELRMRIIKAIGWAYLWGWIAMTILGYLAKIVPFLWWTYKYGDRAGKEKVPKLADMVNDTLVRFVLLSIGSMLLLVMLGIILNVTLLVQIAGGLLSLLSLFYISLIARVFIK